MLTTESLNELRTQIQETADGSQRQRLADSLDDLQRAIVGQALVVRTLSSALRNASVSQQEQESLLDPAAIAHVTTALGKTSTSGFSLAQARQASDELVMAASRGTDLAQIAGAIVKVVRVFV